MHEMRIRLVQTVLFLELIEVALASYGRNLQMLTRGMTFLGRMDLVDGVVLLERLPLEFFWAKSV